VISHFPFKKTKLSPEEWDNFITNSDNGTIFHTRKFLSYHPDGKFIDGSLVLQKDDKTLSLFPAVVIQRDGKKILSSHSGASYGGFVYKKELNLQEAFGIVKSIIEYAKEINCFRIQITPPPIIYQTKFSNYIDYALYKNGFKYLKREISSVVQLDFEKENLQQTFRSEARTALKKAQKLGVEIVECEQFEDYYIILKKNLKLRHNVNPTHTLEELLKLKKMFPSKIRLWGAFVEDKLIAGVCNFSVNPNVVLAFYISHNEEYQEYRAVNLLFFEIMKHYRDEGFKFLDFGIFTVNEEINWGLGRFKENFGARGIFRDTFYLDL
jgi:lipid II:glycine glycyltransferase (peptidoglycan interpeptide bridge formation enzyme)